MNPPVVYLDASVIVPLLVEQPTTAIVGELIRATPRLSLSSFAIGEVISAISRLRRTEELDDRGANAALGTLDGWNRNAFDRATIDDADIRLASGFVRRFDLALRMPDAIHIAVAQRHGHCLATFDQRLADAARTIGVAVLVPA